jgi:hypothetical protein
MIAMLHTYHTNAVDFGHLDSLGHSDMGGDKAKGIVSVNLRYNGCYFVHAGLGLCIEHSLSYPCNVRRDSIDAMSVHAAKVGRDEASRNNCRMLD